MKISVLLNNKSYKILDILKIINKITPLKKGVKSIIGFNDKTATKVFLDASKELQAKRIDKVIIFDEDGFYPFMLLAKQDGICPAYPLDKQVACLTTQHNNANAFIIAKKFIGKNNVELYLNNHLSSVFEGGRHETRTKLMLTPWSKTNKAVKFNPNSKNIIICADHAGYNLKQAVIQHLLAIGYNVLDAGCESKDSTHYPMWAINMGLNADKAFTGIAICSSGVGISITTNKFKGFRCCICHTPLAAKLAKEKFNANVIGLGANFISKANAFKAIDAFLNTKAKASTVSKTIDKYGFKFDKNKFKKVKIDKSILIPDLLK